MNGETLRKIIKDSGRSQKELAEKMGMQPSQWTTYFHQESVTSDVIERLAGFLGMSMAQIYGETDESQNDERKQTLTAMTASAMQGILAANPSFTEEDMKDKTYEQCIAERSVRQAMAVLDELKKQGFGK